MNGSETEFLLFRPEKGMVFTKIIHNQLSSFLLVCKELYELKNASLKCLNSSVHLVICLHSQPLHSVRDLFKKNSMKHNFKQ